MKTFRRALVAGATGALVLSAGILPAAAEPVPFSDTAGTPAKPGATISASDALTPHNEKVVVILKDQPTTLSESAESSRLSTQQQLIDQWKSEYGLVVDRQFAYLVNGFSATIPSDKLLAFSQLPEVESVRKERLYYPTQTSAREMEGVSSAFHKYGVDGTGTVVAIIDSGVDITHQDLRLDNGVCEKSKLKPDATHSMTCKVPYGYNYADDNWEIHDTTGSDHGQHVAGIVAANGAEGPETPDTAKTGRIDGVAPNAQLLAMKVFSNSGERGASDADIVAAIEDSVKLGADIMNLSLGSPNGHANESDGVARAIAAARDNGVLAVISAGNSGLNFSPTGGIDDMFGQLDDGTLGAPSIQADSFSVASIDNSHRIVPVGYWNDNGSQKDMPYALATGEADGKEWPLFDAGLSRPEDYPAGTDLTGKFALIERGEISFADKYANAVKNKAAGVIVFNSEAGGDTFLSMGGLDKYTFLSASVYRSHGLAMREALKAGHTVTVKLTKDQQVIVNAEGLQASDFTSWGPSPTLDFKPNIAGVGGSVYSTINNNKYTTMSGTSMAAPNVSGLSALVVEKYKDQFQGLSGRALTDRIEIALQNTAMIPKSKEGVPLAPRQVGAGLANIDLALSNSVFATVNGSGDVSLREVKGPVNFTVQLENTGTAPVTYNIPKQEVLNESNTKDAKTTTSISSETLTASASTVTVEPGAKANVTFTLTPNTSTNHFIEGWARFESATKDAPNIAVPYLGFVGDWNAERIILEEGKVWAKDVNESESTLVTTVLSMTVPVKGLAALSGKPDAEFWLSPNGDGDADVVAPALVFMRNASEVKYDVLHADGTPVRTIGYEQGLSRVTAGDAIQAGKEGNIAHVAESHVFDGLEWNAAQGKFTPVADGRYIYRVSARLGEGFDWQTYDFSFGVDGTPPQIVFESYENNVLTVKIVEEGSGLAAAPDVVDAAGKAMEYTDLGNNRYAIKVSSPTDSVTVSALDRGFALGVGSYVFAKDAIIVSSREFYNDGLVGPSTNGVSDGKLRIQGFVSDSVKELTVAGQPVEITAGRFTAFVPLTEGPNTIELVGKNAEGKEVAHDTLKVTYDSKPPTLEITNLTAKGGVALEGGKVTVRGKVADERQGAKLTVKVNDQDVTVNPDGTFEYSFAPKDDQVAVPVVAGDGVNTTTKSVAIDDRAPADPKTAIPNITNAKCSNGYSTCLVPGGSPDYADGVFTMRGEGAVGVKKIIFTQRPRVENGGFVAGDPIEVTPDADGKITVKLPAKTGINPFKVEVIGTDDKPMYTGVLRLFVDAAVPSIQFDSPKLIGGTLFTNKPDVPFTGKASDDGWGYTLKINDSTLIELFNYTGHGPVSNERAFNQVVKVADGNILEILLTDTLGNALLAFVPVVLDEAAPQITHSVAEGAVVRDKAPVVTKASDPNLASLNVRLTGKDGEVLNETQQTKLVTKETPVEDALKNISGGKVPEKADVSGTVTKPEETELTHTIDTSKLKGQYTLTATSTDLAGNVTTSAVTFTVNADPVITAPDPMSFEMFREELADQDGLRAKILEQVKVEDDDPIAKDSAKPAAGETTVKLAEGTVLVPGANTVTIIATQADGSTVEKKITVNIAIKNVTLTDKGVSITGPFRSDDALTVTTENNGTIVKLSNKDPYATERGTISIPAAEGTKVYLVTPDGNRVLVNATWADGKLTFEGYSRSTYELVAATKPDPGPNPNPGTDTCTPIARPATPATPTALLGEATGDRTADLWSVDNAGRLHFYVGKADGQLAYRGVVGCDMSQVTALTPISDVNGDNRADVLVRYKDGSLNYYYSAGDGFLTYGKKAGKNWNEVDNITYVGRLGSDGAQYVIARHVATGDLYRYLLSQDGLLNGVKIGHGWSGMRQILGAGQLVGDGNADVIGIGADGVLYAYSGTDALTLKNAGTVGHGWGTFQIAFVPGDVTGDGLMDLYGIREDGNLFFYSNVGSQYGPAKQVGHNWSPMVAVG
ncbi:S8 family serine peptidase [Trueperella sp. LYQ143]|uniref:S8 family serine peptidase n=1 Tax=unclassified Trueperella TaxID=2630174 RepID=UPI003983D51F